MSYTQINPLWSRVYCLRKLKITNVAGQYWSRTRKRQARPCIPGANREANDVLGTQGGVVSSAGEERANRKGFHWLASHSQHTR